MKIFSAGLVALLLLYFVDTQFGSGRYVAGATRIIRELLRSLGL